MKIIGWLDTQTAQKTTTAKWVKVRARNFTVLDQPSKLPTEPARYLDEYIVVNIRKCAAIKTSTASFLASYLGRVNHELHNFPWKICWDPRASINSSMGSVRPDGAQMRRFGGTADGRRADAGRWADGQTNRRTDGGAEAQADKRADVHHPTMATRNWDTQIWPENVGSLSTSITNNQENEYLAGPNYFLLPWWGRIPQMFRTNLQCSFLSKEQSI